MMAHQEEDPEKPEDTPIKIWRAAASSASSPAAQFLEPRFAALGGASLPASPLAPEMPPQDDAPTRRDDTQYEWPVMPGTIIS